MPAPKIYCKGPTATNNKIYNDVTDIVQITSLGPSYLHGPCDVAVLSTGNELKVPTAIVCPPAIYGIGKGPVKTRNGQLPFLGEEILKRGKGFMINEGKDYFDCKSTKEGFSTASKSVARRLNNSEFISDVHVDDVSNALILLTEEALKPNGGKAQWGAEEYYFCEAGDFVSLPLPFHGLGISQSRIITNSPTDVGPRHRRSDQPTPQKRRNCQHRHRQDLPRRSKQMSSGRFRALGRSCAQSRSAFEATGMGAEGKECLGDNGGDCG